jgi:ABC-type transport system involved in multi-copper enzyme maturation permease subunit
MTLFGPVFHKELLKLSRRRSTYYLRALAGLAMLVVVLLYALNPNMAVDSLSTTKRQAAIGEVVFHQWMWLQFWIVCGSMPLLVCSLIAAEREAGSLELLFTTHLSDREIVTGKLASRVLVVVLLAFSALPVLVILGLLGGIDFDRLLKVQLLTLASALLVAAAGLYYSTVAKRPWVACLQTYGLFVLLWAFVPFALIAGYQVYAQSQPGGMTGMPPRWLWFSLLTATPWFDIYFLCDQRGRTLAGWLLDWNGVLMFAGIWFSAALLFLYFSKRELRIGPRKSLVGRLSNLLALPFMRLIRLAFKKRGDHPAARRSSIRFPNVVLFQQNPIVWRNARARVYDPDHHLLRLQIGAWLVAGAMISLFLAAEGRGPRTPFAGILALEIAFLHVMIIVVGAAAISRERQRGSFELLLLSKLSPAAIVIGTFRGVARTCAPTILAVGATIIAATWDGGFTIDLAISYSMLVSGYTAALLAASLLISLASTHAAHAVTATAVVALVMWFLPLPAGNLFAFLDRPTVFVYREDWTLLAFLAGYSATLLAATIVGLLLLRGKRPLVGAVALAFAVPAWALQAVPNARRGDEASMFWRWLTEFKNESYRQSIEAWRDSLEIAEAVPWVYWLAAVCLAAIGIWDFDRIVGRAFVRPRVPFPTTAISNAIANAASDSTGP